jgi:hypothetical protein
MSTKIQSVVYRAFPLEEKVLGLRLPVSTNYGPRPVGVEVLSAIGIFANDKAARLCERPWKVAPLCLHPPKVHDGIPGLVWPISAL